jgi:hypothetical protein
MGAHTGRSHRDHVGRVTSAARAPLRSLSAILFAALLALSLVSTTIDALAASPVGVERVGRDRPGRDLDEFFHGRGLLGITWE